ncbi:sulfatase-like hydrolase/transferase [Nocardia sp. NPDC051030]|uniref:sulfatase-like hydrolase/transferase n=1 Tax=Nocardia sp. NPDC051030 TaxID=3155162 RepID=UPI0034300CCD
MPVTRRSVLTGAAAAAAGIVAGCSSRSGPAGEAGKPNILVLIVDEMRVPMWFPAQQDLDRMLPNIAKIRRGAVSFEQHYTAAVDCTAARGTMLTGLYAHQTGCMLVSQSTLSPLFPTWGSILREQGYDAWYWGKWHLGRKPDTTPGALEQYGFGGGTYPSPNGGQGEGLVADSETADQFINWLHGYSGRGPWCTTVSLLNPHDIEMWPKWPAAIPPIPRTLTDLPPNYETLEQISKKPGLQAAHIEESALAFGKAEYGTDKARNAWIEMRNLYLYLQQQVDIQIGRVLDALDAHPEVAANTVIVFTSDHGDYAGSHGLHGKGGAAYDETIRVPLYVHDPRGLLSPKDTTATRQQLTSSVDLTPLLMTIAAGGDSWRRDARYEHLAGRLDLVALCRDASAPGRPWIAHTTDESGVEEVAKLFNADAPSHVAAVRTAGAKYVSYSHFLDGKIQIDPSQPQEYELYDYGTRDGSLELDNIAANDSPLRTSMAAAHAQALAEINQPLPARLKAAQEQGWADYFSLADNLESLQQSRAALGDPLPSTPPTNPYPELGAG